MKHLLVLLLLVPSALLAQDNPSYDPDFNGDGCYSIADILGLLPLFGSCEPWQCGDSTEFDGYWYETVLIGDQCWFAENLRATVYANGDSIPSNLDDEAWFATIDGATAVYGEGESSCSHFSPSINACDEALSLEAFGRLYNWYAVADDRGICPSGWTVPTDDEWGVLVAYISSQGFAGSEGTALKSTSGWYADGNGTDDFGFSAAPGAQRDWYPNGFNWAGYSGNWWSTSTAAYSETCAFTRYLGHDYSDFTSSCDNKGYGYMIRCILDAE